MLLFVISKFHLAIEDNVLSRSISFLSFKEKDSKYQRTVESNIDGNVFELAVNVCQLYPIKKNKQRCAWRQTKSKSIIGLKRSEWNLKRWSGVFKFLF